MFVNEYPTLTANSALGRYLRVKLSSGKLVVAGASDAEVGTLKRQTLAADEKVAIVPRTKAGVRKAIAGGAISQYAEVFAAVDGKIASSGTLSLGVAMEAASGDGSEINVLWHAS